mmetsp:Transcript_51612/g.120417  ORF Transcript_51612/g.120417 Transcript_51612/m.120417 type:complete len:698 (-) Transcript_51612:127-2220(-)
MAGDQAQYTGDTMLMVMRPMGREAAPPYQPQELESGRENGNISEGDDDDAEDDSEDEQDEVKRDQSSQLHPDDSMHKYWYETTVRLRYIFFVFFSLALVLASALGATTECFFALLATPTSQGLTTGVVIGCVLVPVLLLTSAIYVDECIDMGLDAADRPSFGLFRATVTASFRSCCPWLQTDHVEWVLLVSMESVPILGAILTLVFADLKVYWYKDLFRGYALGGMVFAMLLCTLYVLCHIHVGHTPERDELMAVLYHNMGPLKKFKRVTKGVEKPLVDSQPHWGRACIYFGIGSVLEIFVVTLFIIFHSFFTVFIGQLLATIFWALAVRQYAPRLLGKAFWITFVFFILLTIGLLLGTLANTQTGKKSEEDKMLPIALGPWAPDYGIGAPGNLPLDFVRTEDSPRPGYPICSSIWRHPKEPATSGMDIMDMALMAYASSFGDAEDVREGLGLMLNGTRLGGWDLLEVEDPRTVGRWVVVSFPQLKLRVVSVRGTSNMKDAYADLKLYSGVAVLQMMSAFTPVLSLLPTGVLRKLMAGRVASLIFGQGYVLDDLQNAVARHKAEAERQGHKLLMTGHSLGGAFVGAVAANEELDGIGFSPPGLFYQVDKFSLSMKSLQGSFAIVQPANDVVPRVDKQRGMIQWIECNENAATCHRLTHTACELWAECGDHEKRDWRDTCSKWYNKGNINQQPSADKL